VSCWPLNGMPVVPGGPSPLRRPLAVKIDNAPTARPHYGISQADMVIELLVEGFITRLAAYFHSQDPHTIGAVRSVRFSDRYTTPMVRGSLVFSGASQLMEGLVRGDIERGAYVGVSPQLGQGSTFYRTNVDGKVAPHNLFTSSQALREATASAGGAPSLDMRLIGVGKASIFRDGQRQDGTWSRASYTDPFVFTNFYNQKIYLSPGQTWIHVLPADWDVPSS